MAKAKKPVTSAKKKKLQVIKNSGNDSELTGSDSAGRIGVAYRF